MPMPKTKEKGDFMPMIVDAALVTRKGKNAGFNTGSINASGKLWQREKIHSDKGVFVAGRAENDPYYAVATSGVKGIAETAVTLINDFSASMNAAEDTNSKSLAGFFDRFSSFIKENADLDPSSFSMAVFTGSCNKVHVGLSGKAAAYVFSNGILNAVTPDTAVYNDGVTSYGTVEYNNVHSDDIFLLFGEEVASTISAETVNDICAASDGDIQLILRRIANAAISSAAENSVSLIAVKIIEVEAPYAASIPENAAAAVTTETAEEAEVPADGTAVPDETQTDTQPVSESNKRRTAGFIIISAVLAVFVLILGIVAVKGIIYYKGGKTADETTTAAEESTTAAVESTAAEEESSTEATTTEKATEAATTRAAEKTTARTAEKTTARSSERTTAKTERQTEKTTEKVTEKPTEKSTEKATEKTTASEDEKTTEKVTETVTEESSLTEKDSVPETASEEKAAVD